VGGIFIHHQVQESGGFGVVLQCLNPDQLVLRVGFAVLAARISLVLCLPDGYNQPVR
jgi:hypothetical protein